MDIGRFRRETAAVALIASVALLVSIPAPQTEAAQASDFVAGNIISDERFFDPNAMSQAQVQAFLDQAMPNCRSTDRNLPCLRYYAGLTNTRGPSGPGHCTGYNSEGYESAARIIWRVGQACGINPQVLLVTLQKEQSLVTSQAPTERQYRVAMGYACPDTGNCDAAYYGFFNQVYAAAWQFRQYTRFPERRYKIGSVQIQYHPNAACSSSSVYIQNQATANLYNYTPYQPNQAALANLYGTGDSCSSYGNRNFWRTFTDWFGLPTAQGAAQINAAYLGQGGPGGPLGLPVGPLITIPQNGGGSAQVYTNASIYWTSRTGAFYTWKEIRDYYWRVGGSAGRFGWPTANPAAVGSGEAQPFEQASIYRSSSGLYSVEGALRYTYWAAGGSTGELGWPTSDPSPIALPGASGLVQRFDKGDLYWEPSLPAYFVSDLVRAWYAGRGGPTGAVGMPRSNTIRITEGGGGLGQMFAGGSVYSSTVGTHLVSGQVRDAYWARDGAAGSLGWPTGVASCSSGTCTQSFQGGNLIVGAGSVRVAWPAIDAYHRARGGATGSLGAVVSDAARILENGGGFGQVFERASVYASTPGTFAVAAGVREVYWAAGGAAGTFGWPMGEQSCSPEACVQEFQTGRITAPAP